MAHRGIGGFEVDASHFDALSIVELGRVHHLTRLVEIRKDSGSDLPGITRLVKESDSDFTY
jgi:hypothetical protein